MMSLNWRRVYLAIGIVKLSLLLVLMYMLGGLQAWITFVSIGIVALVMFAIGEVYNHFVMSKRNTFWTRLGYVAIAGGSGTVIYFGFLRDFLFAMKS